MSNHFHLIWQMLGDHINEDVQTFFFEIYRATDIEDLKKREFSYDARGGSKYQRQETPSLGKELIGHTVVVR
ncbi:MAG: hypothetical protein ORN54_00060 [Cyclobacteriaceae bacterium]|nr:hypothetical protein [Cyclobacteriaceae bacterium]